ncbi:MAG: chitobiase/beta-hexosaminidase C-terminal domain-containing protein, partial [Limisphaerales bacterium]
MLTYSVVPSEGTKLYVNGILKQSGSAVQYWPTHGQFRIGSNENGLEQAKGLFENLETFNYPLTPSEISSKYDPTQLPARQPMIHPSSGQYQYAPSIRVIAADAGDIVRYRTDGNEPTEDDPIIESGGHIPIWISEDTTITAKAWRNDRMPSLTAYGTYTLSVGTPGISPPSGVYGGAFDVSIDVAIPGATIRYTIDGTEPSDTSPIFDPETPIHITSTTTVKAKAWKGASSSAVISALYTIRAGPPNDNIANSEVVSGTHGVAYATSLGATTEPFEECLNEVWGFYHDSSVWFEWTPSSNQRITFMADGEKYTRYYLHVISGTIGSCINDSTVASGNESVSFDTIAGTTYRIAVYKDQYSWQRPFALRWFGGIAVSDPIISPGGGTYHSSQFVYVTCDTPGSAVRYTLDGSEPTESSLLLGTGRLSISKSQVLKVKAWYPGLAPSATVTATYVIDHNALTSTQIVLPPVPTPSSCDFESTLDVTAGSGTSGATIRYTLDGREPSANSAELTSPITISSST